MCKYDCPLSIGLSPERTSGAMHCAMQLSEKNMKERTTFESIDCFAASPRWLSVNALGANSPGMSYVEGRATIFFPLLFFLTPFLFYHSGIAQNIHECGYGCGQKYRSTFIFWYNPVVKIILFAPIKHKGSRTLELTNVVGGDKFGCSVCTVPTYVHTIKLHGSKLVQQIYEIVVELII